jgi:hypothetical protein
VAYIAGRIRAAGGKAAQIFTREAVALIYEQSGGIPRTINVLADNALVAGFATGQRPVNSQLVREVCRDFDVRPAVTSDPAPQALDVVPSEEEPEPSVLDLRGTRVGRESDNAVEKASASSRSMFDGIHRFSLL